MSKTVPVDKAMKRSKRLWLGLKVTLRIREPKFMAKRNSKLSDIFYIMLK
jgi:hypothetical protein